MREKRSKTGSLIWSMYGIMLLLTFILIFISSKKYKIESPVDQQYKEMIPFTDGWVNEEGKTVDLLNLYQEKSLKAREEYCMFHNIPDEIKEGYTLNIIAKNVYYQLYVDGKQLVDVYNPASVKRQDSFGRKYSMIPIRKSMAGKTITMKFVLAYDDKSSTFLDATIGLPQGHLLHFFEKKMTSVVTCVIFLCVSILLVLVDIPINMRKEKNHELLALGLFSFVVGMWGLMSTHIFEYFTGDGRTAQITTCLLLSIIALPLLMYIRYSMGLITVRELGAFALISFTEFLTVWILEITNTVDVQVTLKFTHFVLVMGLLLLTALLLRRDKMDEKNKTSGIYHLFRIIGLASLIVGGVVDFFRYYRRNVADNAVFVRFGLLLFIICFGVASLEKTIRAVQIGAKAEFVSHLAYQDGLTNLSNRTAFNERLESLSSNQNSVALIMFDVNNLKTVNDNLGHQYGDEMLVRSAKLISDSFKTSGVECYRIGGDEFVVILCEDNVMEAVIDGLEAFNGNVEEYNKQDNLIYQIRIAYGFAVLEEEKCDIKQLYEIADQRMYERKKRMKASGN